MLVMNVVYHLKQTLQNSNLEDSTNSLYKFSHVMILDLLNGTIRVAILMSELHLCLINQVF
jgi:hypothetical protein